jgi:DNA-binding CsgD family transcriptional regulator
MRPDMARTCLAAARLGLEQARGTVEALAMIGLPAAVLANGRARVTNALFDQEETHFVSTAFGGVALADPQSNRLFQLALKPSIGSEIPRSIPVRTASAPPIVVHILPLKRGAHDLFGGGDVLVVATTISASALVPSPTILTGLFDLTLAEVKLATALAKGLSLKMAANEAGLQLSTVRTYLNRIFRKTGTNQQSQLVALLKSAHSFRH